jgi:hypothetical protein
MNKRNSNLYNQILYYGKIALENDHLEEFKQILDI